MIAMSSRRDSYRHRSRSRSRSPRRRSSPRRAESGRNRSFGVPERGTEARFDHGDRRFDGRDRDRRFDGRDRGRDRNARSSAQSSSWRERRGRSAEDVREHWRNRGGRLWEEDHNERDRRRRNEDLSDLRHTLSGDSNGRFTGGDGRSAMWSSSHRQRDHPDEGRHHPEHLSSRYSDDRDDSTRLSYSRGRMPNSWRGRGDGGGRERTQSTGSLNLNPTDVPRSDRYFEHDNRNDDQGSTGGRGRRRGAGRDNVSQATPARWGHDMFDRYYGEDQTPPPEDEQNQGQTPKSVVAKVGGETNLPSLSSHWESGVEVFEVVEECAHQDDHTEPVV